MATLSNAINKALPLLKPGEDCLIILSEGDEPEMFSVIEESTSRTGLPRFYVRFLTETSVTGMPEQQKSPSFLLSPPKGRFFVVTKE